MSKAKTYSNQRNENGEFIIIDRSKEIEDIQIKSDSSYISPSTSTESLDSLDFSPRACISYPDDNTGLEMENIDKVAEDSDLLEGIVISQKLSTVSIESEFSSMFYKPSIGFESW